MTKAKQTIEQLAEEHWYWLYSVLLTERQMQKKLFIDAFVHGHKHARKEKK